MGEIQEILHNLTPASALAEITAALQTILPLVADEDRLDFIVKLIGGAGEDKVASMVHL